MSKRNRPILLVEDNPNDVELTLTAFRGARVTNDVVTVADGQEALDYLLRQGAFADRSPVEPIVVLLDLKMPRVSGADVLREIRAQPRLQHLSVVVLTSSGEDEDIRLSYQLGTNAYVVKPVDFGDYISAVGTLGLFWSEYNEPPTKPAGPEDFPRATPAPCLP